MTIPVPRATSTSVMNSYLYARAVSTIVMIVGMLAMIGWIFDILSFKTIYGNITIKANTALGLTLTGTSLLIFTFHVPFFRLAGQLLALFVSVLGILTLSQHIFGWNIGIDQFLIQEPRGAQATASPGRMGPPASTSFTLVGASLILLFQRRSLKLSQFLALGVILIATFPILGYAYNAEQLYGVAKYTGIALHTAMSLLLIGTAILSLRIREGITAILCGNDIAGAMTRRLIIPAIVVPFVLGWIALVGQRSSHYDVGFAIALFTLAIISFFTFAIWRTAKMLLSMESRTKHVEAQLRRANQLKDEFLATISHELRTPLNSILGWASMLQRKDLDGPIVGRAIEIIERSARVQAQLIEDLLDVSRIVSGKLRLEPKAIELRTVILEAIDSVRYAAEAKQIGLSTQLEPAARQIMGDPTRLQQVVWNLLSNAVKFTPPGGLVLIKLENIRSRARITVTDNGPGIAADFLPYVFDRFQQEDGTITRKHGGLGLGLAIARHLVELHGGTVQAFSAGLGTGATFQLEFPLLERRGESGTQGAATVPMDAGSEQTTSAKMETLLAGKRILVVDDEKDARDMLNTLLGRHGATISVAGSVQEALAIVLASKPDLLVCDIGMPEEDGYSFIRKVREMPNTPERKLPAIALTGYVRVEERIRALREGFQMFVAKPVEPDELISSIVSLLDSSDSIQKN